MLETICIVLTMRVENNIQRDLREGETEEERERESSLTLKVYDHTIFVTLFNGLVDAHDTVSIYCLYG